MPSPLHRAVPNAITLLRLLVAVAFFVIVAVVLPAPGQPGRENWGLAAAALFAFAAATDFVDGWLARRWQAVTVLGRIMDPFVDKVLVLGAFILLAGPPFVAMDPVSGRAEMLSGV